MPLRSERLTLRAPEHRDLDALEAILREPEVARWWHGFTRQRIEDELITGDDDVTVYVIEHEQRPIGLIQFSEEEDPQYRHAGIDLFLGAKATGKGLGREAIRTVAVHLFDDLNHHRLVIDPAKENKKAIRAYEAVGFRAVGTMREYERGPDGAFHDGLLLEMLKSDFRR